MSVNARRWRKVVAPHFDFLLDAGFAYDLEAEYSEWYGTAVAYRTNANAVVVTRSGEFSRVEVDLARIVDGEISTGPIFYSKSEGFDRALLDNVVIARAPERESEMQEAGGLGKAQVEHALALWAGLLREVADDFLRGDQSVFDDAERVVRERMGSSAVPLTIWLADSASEEERARAVEEARRTVPSDVEILVRRYRQG